jgi:site-specific recombinase XerD
MTSENAARHGSQDLEIASENTNHIRRPRHGRAPTDLPDPFAAVLDAYTTALATAPLAGQTRRTYASKVRQYLVWLATGEADGDPLNNAEGRNGAVRDYRVHLQAVLKRKPATVNNALGAVDDFYIRRDLGPADAVRVAIPSAAPRALGKCAQVRYLRAVQACPSPRNQALALIPFYTGARISEIVGLDVDDVCLSARKGILRIYGKGERVREVPIHPRLRTVLADWLDDRQDWPHAMASDALFLNQRGQRFGVKAAHDVITGIAAAAGLDDHVTAHVLRHTFATTLVRGGTDLVIVAELLGHSRLDTTRCYTRPAHQDRVEQEDGRLEGLRLASRGVILGPIPNIRAIMLTADDLKVALDVVVGLGGSFVLLLPGWVATTVYRRGAPGPDVSDRTLVLQYAFPGAIVHVLLLGWTLWLLPALVSHPADHVIATICWAFGVLVLVPSALGLVFSFSLDLIERLPNGALREVFGRLGVSVAIRTPDAWTMTWRTMIGLRREVYIRVRKRDGSLVLGKYGTRSLASSDPRIRDIYLEELWSADDDDWFGEAYGDSAGTWISGDQIVGLEFFPAVR